MNIMAAQAAGILSGYDGSDLIGYDGQGDDFLDFEGAGSFRNEIAQNRTFMLSVTNTSTTASATVFLNKGYSQWGSAGIKGLIQDGTFQSDDSVPVTCTATGLTGEINELRAFAFFNPLRVLGFKMQTTEQQIDASVFKMKQLSPFRDAEERFAYASWYVDENTYRERIVTVPFGFDLNNQNRVRFVILPSTTIIFTLLVGGILNTSGALDRKANKAIVSSTGVRIEAQTKPGKLFGQMRQIVPAVQIAGRGTNPALFVPQVGGRG